MSVLDEAEVHLVENLDDANNLKRWVGERRESMLCVDTETTGLDKLHDKVRLVQFGDERQSWVVPAEDWRGLIREVLAGPDEWGAWNAKYDATMLTRLLGRDCVKRWHDGAILAHLNDPLALRGLKATATRLIDRRAASMDELLHQKMAEHKWTWATVPLGFGPYWAYAGLDTVLTSACIGKLMPLATERKQIELYELELAAARVCAKMERKGIRIDPDYAQRRSSELEADVVRLRSWCKAEYGFELGQRAPIIARLKADGWDPREFTANGQPSLGKLALAGFNHPLAEALQAKELKSRLAHAYFDKAVAMMDADCRVHPDINPLQAKTGRMSISGLSMHNLPRNSDVRGMFVAGPGCKLVAADFAQIEMRLLVHFARELKMAAFFNAGLDMPNEVARQVYGITDGADVPKPLRQATKTRLYSLAYGAGPAVVGAEFLERFYTMYPRVQWYMHEIQRRAIERDEKRPWVESPRWRRRYFVADPRKAYKLANYLLQGEAGIAFKRQLVTLDNVGLDQYLVLPVHDEVVTDVPLGDVEDVRAALAEHMPDLTSYLVPLTVEVSEPFDNWGEKYVDFDEADDLTLEEED